MPRKPRVKKVEKVDALFGGISAFSNRAQCLINHYYGYEAEFDKVVFGNTLEAASFEIDLVFTSASKLRNLVTQAHETIAAEHPSTKSKAKSSAKPLLSRQALEEELLVLSADVKFVEEKFMTIRRTLVPELFNEETAETSGHDIVAPEEGSHATVAFVEDAQATEAHGKDAGEGTETKGENLMETAVTSDKAIEKKKVVEKGNATKKVPSYFTRGFESINYVYDASDDLDAFDRLEFAETVAGDKAHTKRGTKRSSEKGDKKGVKNGGKKDAKKDVKKNAKKGTMKVVKKVGKKVNKKSAEKLAPTRIFRGQHRVEMPTTGSISYRIAHAVLPDEPYYFRYGRVGKTPQEIWEHHHAKSGNIEVEMMEFRMDLDA